MRNLKQCEFIAVAAGEAPIPWDLAQYEACFRNDKQLETISSSRKDADESGFNSWVNINYDNPKNPEVTVTVRGELIF